MRSHTGVVMSLEKGTTYSASTITKKTKHKKLKGGGIGGHR
jgi:hypothetical protein